ncbi:hypothetical protein KC343_g1152 [Hortaea werneckii]|uniref:Uncharacterized protein n=1 Tax=Hortaea werneckii TaxID=91943 RepID=A0A3M7H6J0_HORWE|nr:hypothetical protein KC320_g3284 [Hortaea werneckii]KAI7571818.1 hypothetical protein KC317_g1310 [Hortaea werneckii]KAI7626529.1 hypothetical protein KC346_g1222 [Hortaea werneckii]KAI7636658.1 hypothetical protein KC343_g1152 [Hortaea werneckii]KAI7681091.1 hypothetical protein KC319_g1771 [Hortaea werneckii]
MPAAVVKGIIVSISIITALSIAVLENPQVQTWLEEQRRKIAEMLRSVGEELDPESRRMAEAFAFEGKTPANHEGLRREVSGSKEAAAVATGRSMSGSGSAVRRIPVAGPSEPGDAEERRRKGREYLARRNQQMYELHQRRKATKVDDDAAPPTPTSFDAMVDQDGKLKGPEISEMKLPSPPALGPVAKEATDRMLNERSIAQPQLVAESSNSGNRGWEIGSRLANPFDDEYIVERSETSKPPIPPKIALEDEREHPERTVPGAFVNEPSPESRDREELSYEEQLAIALSLSEAETTANTATVRQSPQDDDPDMRAAIAASLREMDGAQAAHAIAHAEPLTPNPLTQSNQPHLLDMDVPPSSPVSDGQPLDFNQQCWQRLQNNPSLPVGQPFGHGQGQIEEAPSEATDELYRITPQLTRARLASFDAQQPPPDQTLEASFYSAPSSVPPPPRSSTLDNEPQQLVDVSEAQGEGREEVPSSRSSTLDLQSDSVSEPFASLAGSRTMSPAPNGSVSDIEVVDVEEDSDVDMLSESGIATPDTWTEVGSRDGEESEVDPREHRQLHAGL